MPTVARRVVVTGRVQGVFFRASTRDRARAAGVSGWVRNRPDGAVEAHLQGEPAAVDRVESWMRAGGPPAAAVDAFDARNAEPTDAGEFRVVH